MEFKHFSNIFEDTSRFRMEECGNAMTEEKRISFCQERARANSSVMSVHQTGSYDVCGATLVTTFTIIATNVIKCLYESYAHRTVHTSTICVHVPASMHSLLYCCFLFVSTFREECVFILHCSNKVPTNQKECANGSVLKLHTSVAVNDYWLFTYVKMEFIHRCLTIMHYKDRVVTANDMKRCLHNPRI